MLIEATQVMPQLAISAIAAAIISAVVTVVTTAVTQGVAASQRNKAERLAKEQAAEQRRLLALEVEQDKLDQLRELRLVTGAQRAAFGASGVELIGTPLDVLLESEIATARNLARIDLAFEAGSTNIDFGLDTALGTIAAQRSQSIASGVSQLGGTLLTSAEGLTPRGFRVTGQAPATTRFSSEGIA